MHIINNQHNSQEGFTIIELLLVIGIIGLLATIIIIRISTARTQARDATRISDMQAITVALGAFYSENGRFPNNADDGITAIGEVIGTGSAIDSVLDPYMNPVPADPSNDGTNYFYYYSPTRPIDRCNADAGDDFIGPLLAFYKTEDDKFNDQLVKHACAGPAINGQAVADYDYIIGFEL